MKIPNSDLAIIEQAKITTYLLNREHKKGGSKAKLLYQCGYSLDQWQQLEIDIRKFHLTQDFNKIKENPYGIRYEIHSILITPIGRPLLITTVWQIDRGTELPRLITLIPD